MMTGHSHHSESQRAPVFSWRCAILPAAAIVGILAFGCLMIQGPLASLVPRGRQNAMRIRPIAGQGADGGDEITTNQLGMKLVLVPAGEYRMGFSSRADFTDRDEYPHRVCLSRPFYLGVHEVTVGQFRRFVDATGYRTEGERGNGLNHGFAGPDKQFDLGPYTWRDPGFPQDDHSPVVLVSWNDATEFCRWLSLQENKSYRLPTEAEWEWACRAGATTCFSTGDAEKTLREVANIYKVQPKPEPSAILWGEGYGFLTPVGTYRANRFGLYDMHGNVQEWCVDRYQADYYAVSPATDPKGPSEGEKRVFRGGSFDLQPWYARCANRACGIPSYRFYDLGFRVACDGP